MKGFVIIIFMGVIGASIGWITNIFAIKLLFRPYSRVEIPIIHWGIQGLIPKRRADIATALGNIVSTELITGKDIMASLKQKEVKINIAKRMKKYIQERVLEHLPSVIPYTIQLTLAEYAGNILYQEIDNFLDDPEQLIKKSEMEEIKGQIKRIVEEKILSLDMVQMESLTYQLAKAELKHIEILGGILGFLIGIIQGLVYFCIYQA